MRTSTFTAMVLADLLAGRRTTTAGPGISAGEAVPGGIKAEGEVRPEPGQRDPTTRLGRRHDVHPHRIPARKP